jgi:hypothetical protein
MTIPNKPLIIINYDPDEMTLGESHTLFGETYVVDDFRQFLIDHVDHEKSWTVEEIDAIKRKELNDVRKQLFDQLIDLKVSAQVSEEKAEADAPFAGA